MSERKPIIDGTGVASIARNLAYLLGGQGVYFITRFLYAIIVARLFGPQIYGMINYGIAWYLLFIPLTRMGMETVLIREVGKNRQKGANEAGLNLTLRISSIILVTILYFIISILYETDPESRLMVCVFAFALIGRSLAWWTGSVYIAFEANQYSFRQQTIFRSLEFLLGILVIFIWKEALLVVAIHGFVWCLEAVYGLIIIRRRLFDLRLNFDFAGIKNLLKQGFPLGVMILLMTLPVQGPLIFFRHLASSGDTLGQLALAMQVLFVLSNISIALGSAALPVLSRSVDREDGKDRLYAETMIRYSLLLGCAVALLGTAFGPWLIIQIFGYKYANAGTLIGPVLWLMIPYTIRHALTGVLQAARQDAHLLVGALIGALFFAAAIFEAVIRYGALGSIVCSAAATALTVIYFLFALNRRIKVDFRSSIIKPGLAVFSSVVALFLLNFTGPVISIMGAFAILILICYWLKCLTPQDIRWLKESLIWIKGKVPYLK